MSKINERASTVPFDEQLLKLLDRAAEICNKQWPDADSPAAACRTVYVGVQNGLAEIDRLRKALERILACDCPNPELTAAANLQMIARVALEKDDE